MWYWTSSPENGISEADNKTLVYGGRTLLLHAKRMWIKVINAALWPYALLATAKRHNEFSLDENGDSPLEKFSGTKEKIMSTDWHTWGCPIFVLVEVNQSRLTSTSKWEPSARVGVYFGHSAVYAGNIAFVLNLLTGHVSS